MSEEESTSPPATDEKFCQKAEDACVENTCNTIADSEAFEPEAPEEGEEGAGGDDGEEEAEEEEEDFKFETAPFDPRFPNTNQTKHCFTSFVDYKRCVKLRGEDYAPCEYYKKVYTSMCPNAWVEKWENQIEEGKFTPPI